MYVISTTREPLPGRRVGSGRITGRDSEPVPANPKEVRERREPLRIGGQRERNFERDNNHKADSVRKWTHKQTFEGLQLDSLVRF